MERDLDKYNENLQDGDNDEFKDDEISFRDEEIMLLPERAAFERAGVPRVFEILRTMIDSSGKIGKKLEDLNRKIFRMTLSNEDKFKIFMSIFYQRFKEQLNLTDQNLDELVLLMEKTEHIETKNPFAFVLGYYVISGKKISKIKFENVRKNVIDYVDEVTLPDVIRYSKLIISIL
jgi:hypothetical protein